jgi:hypothetical protein
LRKALQISKTLFQTAELGLVLLFVMFGAPEGFSVPGFVKTIG